ITTDLRSLSVQGALMMACGDSGTIIRSTEGGVTWAKLTTNTKTLLSVIQIVSSNATVASSEYGGFVLKTLDAGASWQQFEVPMFGIERLTSMYFLDAQHGFAGGAYGNFFSTTNG